MTSYRSKPRKAHHGIVTALGLVLGGIMSLISMYQAQAAVKVRPRLAEVDFVTALFTNHGGDWVFYHMPIWGTLGTTLFIVLLFNGFLRLGFGVMR